MSRGPLILLAALVSLASARCGGASSPPQAPSAGGAPSPTSRPPAPAGGVATPPASVTGAASTVPPATVPPTTVQPALAQPAANAACGPFECRAFDSGAAALELVLAGGPVALGIGEAHLLSDAGPVASTAHRFSTELLPALQGRASHLVVELLNPDPRCETATREVRRAQEPVTAPQAKDNQNDYVELGRRARALGIEPFVLSPTCDEYRAIAAAGDGAIDAMLSTIARVTSRMLRGALAKNHAAGRPALVVGYGGALHNDVEPTAEKAGWSYGPDLAAFTGGRYVELDLIVRELIKDNDVWRALPWHAHFDPRRDPDRWLVMRTGAHRYALFFPSGHPSPPS